MTQSTLQDPSAVATRSPRAGYLPYLDGLRGLAIIMVLWFHAGGPLFHGGFIGVDIFFVLSGFLITSLLIKEWEESSRIHLSRFYMRRALRLLPAVVVLLAVDLAVSVASGHKLADKGRDVLVVLFYSANWTRALGWDLHELGHAWSLSIEEQFYLLWPPLFILLMRSRLPRKAVAGVAVSIAISSAVLRGGLFLHAASSDRVYNGLDTRCDALLFGCAIAFLAIIFHEQLARSKRSNRLASSLTALALLTIALTARWNAHWMFFGGYAIVAMLSAVLVLGLQFGPEGTIRGLTEWPALVKLGRISYGVYLWHFPIFTALEVVRQHLHLHVRWPFILFVGGAVTIGVASASYRWIELPFLRLKSRFAATARKSPSPLSLVPKGNGQG